MTKDKITITYNHNSRILRRAFDPGFLAQENYKTIKCFSKHFIKNHSIEELSLRDVRVNVLDSIDISRFSDIRFVGPFLQRKPKKFKHKIKVKNLIQKKTELTKVTNLSVHHCQSPKFPGPLE